VLPGSYLKPVPEQIVWVKIFPLCSFSLKIKKAKVKTLCPLLILRLLKILKSSKWILAFVEQWNAVQGLQGFILIFL
jgi:hypothetical protein